MRIRLPPIAFGLALLGLGWWAGLAEALPLFSSFRPWGELQTHLSWGGVYHRVEGVASAGWVKIHYLTLNSDFYRPAVMFSPQGLGTLSPLSEMVRQAGAIAGINANFFDPPTGVPIGFLLKDARVLNTPYGHRATLAIGFFGQLHFLNPQISPVLRTSQGFLSLDGVNRPPAPDALILYTPEYAGPRGWWGDARIVAIRDERILWIGSGWRARSADRDTYWLVATGSAQTRLTPLLPADWVKLDYQMTPEIFFIRDALQAGPMLVHQGQIALASEGFQPQVLEKPAARSALAITQEGSLIVLVVTQGRDSAGLTSLELAQYLRTLHAMEAIAFDGGSSSSLAFREGEKLRTIGSHRSIPVSLVFVRR